MSAAFVGDWQAFNQQYLSAALSRMRARLRRHAYHEEPDDAGEPSASAADTGQAAALETLCRIFGLTPFERDLLLLCAGVELDSSFADLCAEVQQSSNRRLPTFSLALATLPDAHWSALAPSSPLRHWRLIEFAGTAGDSLTRSPLRIDERILHYLAGVQHLDERLSGLIEPLIQAGQLVPSHLGAARRIQAVWSVAAESSTAVPLIQLCQGDPDTKREIAAAACAGVGLNLWSLSTDVMPSSVAELEGLQRLWEREAALTSSALYVEADGPHALDHHEGRSTTALRRLLNHCGGPLILGTDEQLHGLRRPNLAIDIAKPTTAEQQALWRTLLGETAASLNGSVDRLVAQFELSAPAIQRSVWQARFAASDAGGLADALWDAGRQQSRPRLDDLAQRIEPAAGWDDLILPAAPLATLREIAAHLRQRTKVYSDWGFGRQSRRGLGISVLFAGASGTGKTMAAEVLAADFRLDLYRIDLSQVVSKYIGETEKNLRRVFDAAEDGGAILLFDEADALFGKRSEVKDSHDRYANIEVSYLLQRMEAYRGLAILTTNMKTALDQAFLRRIRFIVQFPFPDAAHRAGIWRHIFPPETPTHELDIDKLARLSLAGGNIRNIALNAAFLAADAGEPVRMTHLLQAARSEYAKIEKPLPEAEIRGWV